MGAPTELPARFPCWCKATYSWGGETKKDLGFIEGDLIEALNAGDGQWWMGRLRRDPRAIGLFPSNFVTVLDQSFQPAPNSRNSSLTQIPPQNTTPTKSKSVFRKPFQAYEEVGKRGSLELNRREKEGTPESEKEKRKEKSKYRPYSSMKTAQAPTGSLRKQGTINGAQQALIPRIPSPPPRRGQSRPGSQRTSPVKSRNSSSPRPAAGYGSDRSVQSSMQSSRAPSPQPSPQSAYQAWSPALARSHSPIPRPYHDEIVHPEALTPARQPSPNPHLQQRHYSAQDPPSQFDYEPESSPPPPPPAHRTLFHSGAPASPQPRYSPDDTHYAGSPHTPIPPSPSAGSHMTPSPLRDAMNDVMSSLYDMSMMSSPPGARAETPPSVWSPEAFELVRSQSRSQSRAQTSLGLQSHRHYREPDEDETSPPPLHLSHDEPPQMDDYIERMEHQLRHEPSLGDLPPQPPLKGSQFIPHRSTTSGSNVDFESDSHRSDRSQQQPRSPLRTRKSAYEMTRPGLDRTYTTKTNVTNSTESSSATQSSASTQLTSRSIMSGYSAGGFSATSAGSLARRKFGLGSQRGIGLNLAATKSAGDLHSSTKSMAMSESSGSGPSYHESHASHGLNNNAIVPDWTQDPAGSGGVFGGLSTPQTAKRSSFFKKMIETAKTTAKTGAANARSTIGNVSRPGSRSGSPTKNSVLGNGITSISGGTTSRPTSSAGAAARDMGLGAGSDWMQVRRDVNRTNSLSRRERDDRAERCEMHDILAVNPVDHLNHVVEGDEGLDGLPISEPTDFSSPNLSLVDKSTRFVQSLPSMISASALAQNYLCRPYRSDVQRLRAIFTWVSERVTWEEDFEGELDTRRVIQSKRGCSEEFALLVRDMCTAIGLCAEVVRGYLKGPGEVLDLDMLARPNHWWNAVIVDGEWRIMDCALASPTHPRRSAYSSCGSQVAESWYFLARPMEICYTHIPLLPEQQHLVPPVEHEVLIALPCACPTYFRKKLELFDFNTSMLHLENLEMAHIHLTVPDDVECLAESESRTFAEDPDGDFFESGDLMQKKCLAQADWVCGRKRFTIKATLPGDGSHGVLRIYAGKRGLMHSIKDNPHALALALPLAHTGPNPAYDFLTRHPTPHAQRHDLYVVQPQCARLVVNNTFVFAVRQHPASLSRFTPDSWGAGAAAAAAAAGGGVSGGGFSHAAFRPASPAVPPLRPTSALSMVSASMSTSGSQYSDASSNAHNGGLMTPAQQKPAKLAIQSPSQKIIRLTRKQEHSSRGGGNTGNGNEDADGNSGGWVTSWETVVKISERGTWRGLVLADRSARWCVFAEWECV